jgi:hypothetical protein
MLEILRTGALTELNAEIEEVVPTVEAPCLERLAWGWVGPM